MSGSKVGDENARGLASISDDASGTSASETRRDHPCQTRLFEADQQAGRERVASSERDRNPKGGNPKGFRAKHESPAPKGLAQYSLAIVELTDSAIILRYIYRNISAAHMRLGYLRMMAPDRVFQIVQHVQVGR